MFLFLCLLAAMIGCSKPADKIDLDGSQAAEKEDTSKLFTLYVSYWAVDQNGYFAAAENKFKEKYPNASIIWNKLDEKTFLDVIDAEFKAGTASDIIFHQKVKAYAKEGYLLDLSDQPWVDRMIDSAKQVVAYQGKTYGAALDVSTFGVFYNKDIFADLKLQPPTSWDEFISLCKAIKAAGKAPIVGGFKDVWTIQGVYLPIAATSEFLENPNFEIDLYDGKTKIDGSEIRDAMDKFTQLAHLGFFNEDALSIGYDQSVLDFIDGKGAMQMMGSWTPGVVDSKKEGFNLGFFALPDHNGKTVMAAAPDKQVSINAKTPYIEEAKQLLAILLDKEMLAIYSRNLALSAFIDVRAEFSNPAMKEVQKSLQIHPTSINPGHLFTNSANNSINEALTRILLGHFLEDELKEADENYKRDRSTIILD